MSASRPLGLFARRQPAAYAAGIRSVGLRPAVLAIRFGVSRWEMEPISVPLDKRMEGSAFHQLTLSRRHRSHFDDFEVAASDLPDRSQFIMHPAIVGSATDKPVATVVGQDHAVRF